MSYRADCVVNVVEVKLVRTTLDCRRCSVPIRAGQRAALVLGAGQVHLRCLLDGHAADTVSSQRNTPDQSALADDETVHGSQEPAR